MDQSLMKTCHRSFVPVKFWSGTKIFKKIVLVWNNFSRKSGLVRKILFKVKFFVFTCYNNTLYESSVQYHLPIML